MGVDFYTCEQCEECVNENYIYTGSESYSDEYDNIFKRININKKEINICEHRLCDYCLPNEFMKIKNDDINDDSITIDVLKNPWNYCKLCNKDKKDTENKEQIMSIINNENTTIEDLKSIILKLIIN